MQTTQPSIGQFLRSAAMMIIAGVTIAPAPALAADLAVSFGKSEPGRMLPPQNAACLMRQGKFRAGANESPSISWSKGPAGTKSYALTMIDPDVPVDRSGFNKESVVIAETAPRETFVHWVLADIPADFNHLPQAIDGNGLVKSGLPLKRTDHGRRGQNGFGEGSLKNGPQGGYHGACPPWNDQRIHHYRVTLYALDVEHLALPEAFTAADLMKAADGHILSSGTAELRYTMNARARE